MNANIATPLLPLAIPITDCHPDPTNARTGHAIDRIAASLRQYGQRKPIVVNVSEGGKIEAGNGTWEAARSLGWTHIAAVTVEDDPMTAVGYGIADNRTGDMSGWDAEILAILAESLPPETYTGFEGGELNEILEELYGSLSPTEPANDPAELWAGMPEFEHEDLSSIQSIHVHFRTREDVGRFGELIKQKLTDNTRSIWFPKAELIDMSSELYRNES